MLAFMALRFTKTNPDGDPTSQKSRRNVIYIFCAALIAASMLIAFVANFLPAAVKQSGSSKLTGIVSPSGYRSRFLCGYLS